MNTFQCFQSVKVTDEGLADVGRAGGVRSAERIEGTAKNPVPTVDVQLDGDDAPKAFPVASLQAL